MVLSAEVPPSVVAVNVPLSVESRRMAELLLRNMAVLAELVGDLRGESGSLILRRICKESLQWRREVAGHRPENAMAERPNNEVTTPRPPAFVLAPSGARTSKSRFLDFSLCAHNPLHIHLNQPLHPPVPN